MEKQKRMNVTILLVFYIGVFIPVINGTINFLGNEINYQVNISHLNFGLGFNLIFLALMLFGLYTLFFRPKLKQISDWLVIVVVGLVLLMLILAKDASESFGIGYFILWFDWVAFIMLKFMPSVMETLYDYVVKIKDKLVTLLSEKSKDSNRIQEQE